MADINIERKRGSIWPWIIGLVLLAIVVFVVLQYMKAPDDTVLTVPDSAAVIQQPQYQPAPIPATTDSLGGDSTRNDSVPAETTSTQ
jgi:hypothetical protein